MTEHAVVIAGAGPTGLMLGAELSLAGVDVAIVERRTSQDLESSRAGGLHARTLEVLDQRGVADRFLDAGHVHPAVGYGQIRLDISDFPSRHNYLLALWQRDFERILAGWVAELQVPILRGRDVVSFTEDHDGVAVVLSDGTSMRAGYLVGCDGGRSAIRKTAGIGFPGADPSVSFMIAEVLMVEEPKVAMRPEGGGIGPVDREKGGNPYNVVLREQRVDHTGDPTLDDLRQALVAAYGTDFGGTPRRGSRGSTTPAAKPIPTGGGGSYWPGTPPTSTARSAAKVSTPEFRTPSISAGSWAMSSTARRPTPCSTAITPNAIPSPPVCSRTRWRRLP
jgi:3-(3-hydroxy-phenyl)propionate hydroxylase